jgi:hypothetical protein
MSVLRVDELTSSTGKISITPGQVLDLSESTSSLKIPRGTTAQQGTPGASGLRYDTSEGVIKSYGSEWNKFKNIKISDYDNLYKPGLIFDVDAGNIDSYPGTGIGWYDLSRVKNNVTLFNGVSYSSSNPKSFIFDGVDDNGRMSNIFLGNGNIEWTATAWMKTTTTVNALGQGSILSNASGGPVYSMMGVNNGKIVYWTYQNNAWAQKLGVGKNINDNQWHFLSWVNYNNNTMDMYVDGLLDSNVANSTSGNNNPIDMLGSSWAARFSGSISYVSIYNRALTSAQILQNYNALKNRHGIQ